MLSVRLVGVEKTQRWLDETGRKQLPFATARALTWTAQQVKEEEVATMQRVFDRPTKFTLNSLQLTPAKKQSLEARVWFKNPTRLGSKQHYLEPQVSGGSRELKRFERMLGNKYLMPGAGQKLNRYGNIPGSRLVQILSALKRFGEVGHSMNITDKSSKGGGTRDFFLVKNHRGGLAPGVWQRVATKGRGFRGASKGAYAKQKGKKSRGFYSVVKARGVRPILIATKTPSYNARFPFYEVGQKVVDDNLNKNFSKSFDEAMRSAR